MSRCFGYTIYKNPSDMPGHYVLRGWNLDGSDVAMNTAAIATPINDAALNAIRETMIDMGLICVERQETDDPVIVESWI